jgi:hypothetical protein
MTTHAEKPSVKRRLLAYAVELLTMFVFTMIWLAVEPHVHHYIEHATEWLLGAVIFTRSLLHNSIHSLAHNAVHKAMHVVTKGGH